MAAFTSMILAAAAAAPAYAGPADRARDAGARVVSDPWAIVAPVPAWEPSGVEAQPQAATPAFEERPLRRPESALRAGGASSAASGPAGSWLRTLLSLGTVLGLIGLLAWMYRRVGAGLLPAPTRNRALIEVVSRTALSPRQSLCLVRVGPRLVLVGTSGDRISPLDAFTDGDLAARLAGAAAAGAPSSAVAEFRRCLEREALEFARAEKHAEHGSETRAT